MLYSHRRNNMDKTQYFIYSLTQPFTLKQDWYFTFFSIFIDSNGNNPYLRNLNNTIEVKVDGKWVPLDVYKHDEPIYQVADKITLPPNTLLNQKYETNTTIGRAIANRILLTYPFKEKIEYKNDHFGIGDIENIISELLRIDKVTVEEYLLFKDSVMFIKGLSRLFNISATPKNITPPPGIEKYKKDLTKEYNEKYGKDWVRDRTKVLEFKEQLKERDKEWLKDDPSNGKLIGGKIKNNARVKMYLTFGDEVGFDKESGKMTFVPNSLSEQYPTDPEQITAMINSAIAGSYDRGKETQKGGVTAKELLRSTSSYSISDGDCGSTTGLNILVTKVNAKSLNGRYMVVNNKIERIEKGEDLIGKNIILRSPMYCANKDSSFCSKCCGDSLSLQKTGISLVVLDISQTILTISLKSMHVNSGSLLTVDMNEMLT